MQLYVASRLHYFHVGRYQGKDITRLISLEMHGLSPDGSDPSAPYYYMALSRLSENLKDPIKWQDATNVAATPLLGIYEVCHHHSGWSIPKLL